MEIKGATSGESLRLDVFDLHGRLVLQNKLMASGNLFQTEITLPPGVFELKISGDNKGSIQKVIVQ
ncbi:MAG: T9SS type A sorting domain-containing protein [Saprospirales bacterium]|nr:T9SS type A sorting domain-containing protein [Saprospirales bacterium]